MARSVLQTDPTQLERNTMTEDEKQYLQKQKLKEGKRRFKLLVELGLSVILLGLMLSVIADAFYESVVGLSDVFDMSYDFVFLVFGAIFFFVFFVFSRLLIGVAVLFWDAGKLTPRNVVVWICGNLRAGLTRRNLIVYAIIAVISASLAAIFALILTVAVWISRNPELIREALGG